MFKQPLSVFLSVLVLLGSITCGFTFTASAESANMIITPTKEPTTLRSTTAETRLTDWSRSSSGSTSVTTEDGYTVVSRTGIGNGSLFTNTFTIEKSSTYKFSFEIKAVDGTSFSYTKSSGETVPRNVNFVLNDFNVVKSDGSAYTSYSEGHTDYAHTSRANDGNPTRAGFTCTWTHELADGSTHKYSNTKYSSYGRKLGTSEAETAALKTIDLNALYSDWRTVTCEFTTPNEDVYTASDIAIGFVLPGNASNGGIYVRNVEMYKQVTPIPDNTVAYTVIDANGNAHPSAADIPVTTTAKDNGNGTYNLGITYDAMDGVNSFIGWYSGETLLSENESYTTNGNIALADISAKILCNSVITGGLGFESYKSATSLRVDPKQSATPPYDDKWGIWSNFTTDTEGEGRKGYENIDWNFDIKSAYGDTSISYVTAYDAETESFVTGTTTVKPYSGKSMFYFAARSRSIVRKLDNLKPNTEYEVSFYTYNLSKWDFFSKATVADTYDMKTGVVNSTGTVKVYGSYVEPRADSTIGYMEIADTDSILNWKKISFKFTTDEDATEAYLHLCCDTGNNSSSTSKQFIDNLTVAEVPQPQSFSECTEFVGNSIRRESGNTPQALRYKFAIDNYAFDVYKDKGYELNEYGAIVTKSDYISTNDDLVINDSMTIGDKSILKGVAYNKEDGTDIRFETTEDGVIISFALYNIGATPFGTNYDDYNAAIAVRPYAIYEDAEGNEHIYYDGLEECALFDVTDAVLSKSTANSIAANYGNTSNTYASYLADVTAVRKLLAKEEVNAAYTATNRDGYTNNTDASCAITPADLGDNVAIHTELQASYLADEYNSIANYADGTAELSRPVPVDFSFAVEAQGNGDFLGYLLTLSENNDLSDGKFFAIQSTSTEIWNLKIGTKYYWNVTAFYTDGIYISATSDFTTETTAPRNLYISGVTNVRDIGGWTINGKQTNQGLIFRTGKLDNTTENGKTTLFEELGVKTEIDIRLESEAKNTFGDKINYYAFYMGYSGSILTSNHESIVKFFEILGDESNYPIVYHCSIGTDRTGMMSFLLNGLLGATEEQLYRDYLYSNFGNISSSRDTWAIGSYLGYVNKCEGDTLSERIYNYLLNIGVKADDINTYIRMMTK